MAEGQQQNVGEPQAQAPPVPQQQQQPQQQPKPQLQHHVVNTLGQQLGQLRQELKLELRMDQAVKNIRPFDEEGHDKFMDWINDMEWAWVQMGADDEHMRTLAMATLTGPTSNFCMRGLLEEPLATWHRIRETLKCRFSDISDTQRVLQSLTALRQSSNKSV